jgi:DNA-binding NarL/FixJ family response regulator
MGTSVLVVDDHPAFRAGAGRLLRAEGYEVVGEAADGEQAVVAARELRPEMVLLDVGLPGSDGFAVARELAGDPGGPAIVLVTGRDAEELEPLVDASPARGLLAKDQLSGPALAALLHRPPPLSG